MHFTNTQGHITHTQTRMCAATHFQHTAESQVPQESVKIEKPPKFAGMTSKKQSQAGKQFPTAELMFIQA